MGHQVQRLKKINPRYDSVTVVFGNVYWRQLILAKRREFNGVGR